MERPGCIFGDCHVTERLRDKGVIPVYTFGAK